MDQIFENLREKVNKESIALCAFTMFIGFICHGFAYANYHPTYGGLEVLVKKGSGLVKESRWFSAILLMLDGKVTMPFFLGALSLLFWSISVVYIVKVLEIKSRIVQALIGACFVSFPVVATMNSFLYMADFFAVSSCLACAGVYYWNKYRLASRVTDLFISIILLTCCLATYQPSLSLALVLIFVRVALDIFEEEKIKKIWVEIGLAFIVVIGSFVLWLLCDYLIHKILHIDSVTSTIDLSISSLIKGIEACYLGFSWFMYGGTFLQRLPGRIIIIVDIALLICAISIVVIIKRTMSSIMLRIIMLIGLVILSPIAACYTFLAMPDTAIVCRLFGGLILFFVLPLIVIDKESELMKDGRIKKQIYSVLCVVSVLCSVYTSLFFIEVDNTAYMSALLKYEKDYSLAVRIVDRIESDSNYEKGMPVMILVGAKYAYDYDIKEGDLDEYITGMNQSGGILMYNLTGITNFVDRFIQTDMNIEWHYLEPEEADEIGIWPSSDCTKVIDGVMYLRLS